MKCTNCNAPIPGGTDVCPYCGTEIDISVFRCPECFIKLEKGTEYCPKCGCNIEKALLEESIDSEQESETLFKKILKTSLKVKIISLVIIMFAAAAAIFGFSFYNSQKTDDYCKYADEYIAQTQKNIKTITFLAEEYDKIYKGEWLIQTENARDLEKKYSDEISELKDSRDDLNFLVKELLKKTSSKKDASLVGKVYDDYESCYLYVVEKSGEPNGYISGYYKLYDSYKNSIKTFKDDVQHKKKK